MATLTKTAALPLHFSQTSVVITGAASGIGQATTELLKSSGLCVYAVDRTEIARSPGVKPIVADLRNDEDLNTLSRHFEASPGYLVNCAGILDPSGFSGVNRDAFLQVMDINLVGTYRLIDVLRNSGRLKSVVNVSSIEASRVVALSNPDPHPAYAASKAAVTMLTRTAARALADENIRVNAVAPGFVKTSMAVDHGSDGQIPQQLASRVPLGRYATPREIAYAIAFLLSDEASYITGSEITVDGGFKQT